MTENDMLTAHIFDHAGTDLPGVGFTRVLAHILSRQLDGVIPQHFTRLRETDEWGCDNDFDRTLLRHQPHESTEEVLRLLGGHVHFPVGCDDGFTNV
jgi:hypothetical protein